MVNPKRVRRIKNFIYFVISLLLLSAIVLTLVVGIWMIRLLPVINNTLEQTANPGTALQTGEAQPPEESDPDSGYVLEPPQGQALSPTPVEPTATDAETSAAETDEPSGDAALPDAESDNGAAEQTGSESFTPGSAGAADHSSSSDNIDEAPQNNAAPSGATEVWPEELGVLPVTGSRD